MVTDKLRKLSEKDENTKQSPPMRAAPNRIVCSWNQFIRYFTKVPPKMYPNALQKKTKE